jgi:hypothetical protein
LRHLGFQSGKNCKILCGNLVIIYVYLSGYSGKKIEYFPHGLN